GSLCYAVFFGTFLYAIGFVSGLVVPKTIDMGAAVPAIEAVIVDLVLLCVFALQHSVMARRPFKAWWTQFVPISIERSTLGIFARLALSLLFWLWRTIATVVWSIEEPQDAMLVTGVSLAGWLFVLASTCMISHFELFGLHQVIYNLSSRPMPASSL